MEIKQISAQPQFTAVMSSGLTVKQRAIYKKLMPLLDAVSDFKGYDLYVTRSDVPYVHRKSGRYEHCAQISIMKDGKSIRHNAQIPNTTRAWMKALGEISDMNKTPTWKLYKTMFKKMLRERMSKNNTNKLV